HVLRQSRKHQREQEERMPDGEEGVPTPTVSPASALRWPPSSARAQRPVLWERIMSLMRSLTALASAAAALAMFTTVAVADTTIEFVQWWEPELPAGALRGIMDSFEAANPGTKVKLVSGPFSA